jgi:hypothetical protein
MEQTRNFRICAIVMRPMTYGHVWELECLCPSTHLCIFMCLRITNAPENARHAASKAWHCWFAWMSISFVSSFYVMMFFSSFTSLLYVYICTCVHIFTHIHTYVHTYTYKYINTKIYTRVKHAYYIDSSCFNTELCIWEGNDAFLVAASSRLRLLYTGINIHTGWACQVLPGTNHASKFSEAFI